MSSAEDKKFVVDVQKIKKWVFGADYLRISIPPYRDMMVMLCINKIESNLYFGFEVQLPPTKRQVTFKYSLNLSDPKNHGAYVNLSHTRNSVTYDNSAYGSNHSALGVDGASEYKSNGGFLLNFRQLDDYTTDGVLHMSYRFYNYKETCDTDSMILKLYNKLYKADEESAIEKLEKEKAKFEEDLMMSEQSKAVNERELNEKKKQLEVLQKQIEILTTSNDKLTKENLKIQTELTDMNTQNKILSGELKECKATTAFQQFDPNKIRLDLYDVNAKRALLLRLLEIQKKLADEIVNQELCGICKKADKQYAVLPCSHMAFCKNCYKDKLEIKNNPKPLDIPEIKPVDAKTVEANPVDVKPVDAKTVEANPAEIKPPVFQPVEANPAEIKLPVFQPVEVKPIEVKPAEVKPVVIEEKPIVVEKESKIEEKIKKDIKCPVCNGMVEKCILVQL